MPSARPLRERVAPVEAESAFARILLHLLTAVPGTRLSYDPRVVTAGIGEISAVAASQAVREVLTQLTTYAASRKLL
jgi:hypothetical protein